MGLQVAFRLDESACEPGTDQQDVRERWRAMSDAQSTQQPVGSLGEDAVKLLSTTLAAPPATRPAPDHDRSNLSDQNLSDEAGAQSWG